MIIWRVARRMRVGAWATLRSAYVCDVCIVLTGRCHKVAAGFVVFPFIVAPKRNHLEPSARSGYLLCMVEIKGIWDIQTIR